MNVMNEQRQRILDEIYQTEKFYVESMEYCLEYFYKELNSDHNPTPMTKEDVLDLFQHYDQILNINKGFKLALDKLKEEGRDGLEIGKTFLLYIPFFKGYIAFISHFDRVNEILKKYEPDDVYFQAMMKIVEKIPTNTQLDLRSYLIMPVQRLPRYELLLKDLMNHTELTHPDFNNIQEAYEKIKLTTLMVNERSKEFEQRNNVLKASRLITGLNFELVQPDRSLIMEGEMIKICKKANKPRYFYLFNDLIVYGIGFQRIQVSEYFFLKTVELEHVHKIEHSFSIKNDTKSFTVICKDEKTKEKWFTEISKHAENMKKKSNEKKEECRPVFVPDSEVTECMLCKTPFTKFFRRHHCRKCGMCICNDCSKGRMVLKEGGDAERVCRLCLDHMSQFQDNSQAKKLDEKERKKINKMYSVDNPELFFNSLDPSAITTTPNGKVDRKSKRQRKKSATEIPEKSTKTFNELIQNDMTLSNESQLNSSISQTTSSAKMYDFVGDNEINLKSSYDSHNLSSSSESQEQNLCDSFELDDFIKKSKKENSSKKVQPKVVPIDMLSNDDVFQQKQPQQKQNSKYKYDSKTIDSLVTPRRTNSSDKVMSVHQDFSDFGFNFSTTETNTTQQKFNTNSPSIQPLKKTSKSGKYHTINLNTQKDERKIGGNPHSQVTEGKIVPPPSRSPKTRSSTVDFTGLSPPIDNRPKKSPRSSEKKSITPSFDLTRENEPKQQTSSNSNDKFFDVSLSSVSNTMKQQNRKSLQAPFDFNTETNLFNSQLSANQTPQNKNSMIKEKKETTPLQQQTFDFTNSSFSVNVTPSSSTIQQKPMKSVSRKSLSQQSSCSNTPPISSVPNSFDFTSKQVSSNSTCQQNVQQQNPNQNKFTTDNSLFNFASYDNQTKPKQQSKQMSTMKMGISIQHSNSEEINDSTLKPQSKLVRTSRSNSRTTSPNITTPENSQQQSPNPHQQNQMMSQTMRPQQNYQQQPINNSMFAQTMQPQQQYYQPNQMMTQTMQPQYHPQYQYYQQNQMMTQTMQPQRQYYPQQQQQYQNQFMFQSMNNQQHQYYQQNQSQTMGSNTSNGYLSTAQRQQFQSSGRSEQITTSPLFAKRGSLENKMTMSKKDRLSLINSGSEKDMKKEDKSSESKRESRVLRNKRIYEEKAKKESESNRRDMLLRSSITFDKTNK